MQVPRRCRALTLLEVIVSIGILSGVVAGMFALRSRARLSAHAAHEMLIADSLAASESARLRAGLTAEGEGTFAEPAGYRWRIQGQGVGAVQRQDVHVVTPSGEACSEAALTVWHFQPPQEAPR